MDFKEAVQAMVEGRKVTRKGRKSPILFDPTMGGFVEETSELPVSFEVEDVVSPWTYADRIRTLYEGGDLRVERFYSVVSEEDRRKVCDLLSKYE